MTGSDLAPALRDLAHGKMVLLRGTGDRAGGALLIGAGSADADAVNFMAREGRGLICLVLTAERCEQLGLRPIAPRGDSKLAGQAMVSIEGREGVTTGISAADRARTIAMAVDRDAGPDDFDSPGHIFPLRARPADEVGAGGRVEAAIAATVAAGLPPAAVICEVVGEDGAIPGEDALDRFIEKHGLAGITAADLPSPAGSPAPDLGRQLRDVMGHFATGVSVITCRRPDGSPVGTTVNALSSVSLDPPLLLTCLANDSETLATVEETRRFAVNVLAHSQRRESERFAAKGDSARPHEVAFEDHPLNLPLLPDALATIACEVIDIHPAGDHRIVVGRVRTLARAEDTAEPLIFYRGSYRLLDLEDDQLVA